MGGPRHQSVLAVVVGFVCTLVVSTAGSHPVAAAPPTFSPPGHAQSQQHSRHSVASRAQTSKPPTGLAGRSSTATPAAPSVPSSAWVPVGPSPTTGNLEDPSQSPPGSYGDVSGRVTALATDPTNAATVYAGAADGGVWKSTNAGGSWAPLTDSQATLAVGSLAIDSTGQIIYAGTGEPNGAQDAQYGDGVLKSTDAGSTWTLQGSSTFAGLRIGSMVIDSAVANAQHVFAATDAGLYVSTNGGGTWARNTNIDGAIIHLTAFDHSIFEIHQDPALATRFFATVGDFCQNEQGQVLVSGDSGSTWSNSDSLSSATDCAMRVSLGAGPNNTEYSAWTDTSGDLRYIRKSVNGGVSWATVLLPPAAPNLSYFNTGGSPQGWYDNVVAVDPTNANRAVFGGVTVLNTSNGGGSFTDVGHVYDSSAGLHPDFHAIAFTGANTLYIGNDGGVYYSTTLGGTSGPSWSDVNSNLAITQFYSGSALSASTLIGGAQDVGDPGRLPTAPPSPFWQQYGVGDGTYTAIKPGSNGNSFYISVPQAGVLQQTSQLFGGVEGNPTIAAPCDFGSSPAQGTACADPAAFVAPFVMDPANGNRLFAATNHVYSTATGGLPAGNRGWSQISPNLTSGTANFQGNADVINAMTMIPGTNTIVTGAGLSGTVFRTTSGGSNWVNISGNLPQPSTSTFAFAGSTGWITSVAINPANAAEVWVTIGDSIGGTGTVWHTTTAGTANIWADLSSGGTAPITGPVNSIVQDPTTPTTLYVGTALGVYTCSGCGGGSPTPSWSAAGTGLPAVSVDGVTVSNDNTTLIAWTHGRGAWELPLSGSGTPVANLQPSSLTFLSPSSQTVTLSNWGDASLSPTVTLTGANARDFSKQTDGCSGQTLAPNRSCTVTVAFTPTDAGSLSAALQFTDNAPGSPQSVSLSGNSVPALYTLDGYGGVHNAGSAPSMTVSAYWAGWNIARGLALFANGTGGYVLDGYGGVNPAGNAPHVSITSYWRGYDIAHSIVLAPWATASNPQGWVLDGYGGISPFGGAPPIFGESWWGFDIARGIVILPDSTPSSVSGYTLDGYGGVHPFGAAPSISDEAYWYGWDIAKAVVLTPWSTAARPQGYVLDGYGGINPFGGAPPISNESYWAGFNIARGVFILRGSTPSSVAGYTLDGYGGTHHFGVAPPVSNEAYWPGWDIAHAIAGD